MPGDLAEGPTEPRCESDALQPKHAHDDPGVLATSARVIVEADRSSFRASVALASIGPECHRWVYGSITDQVFATLSGSSPQPLT